MRPRNVKGVVQVGVGAALLVGHGEARIVCGEGGRKVQEEGLDLVVAFHRHEGRPAEDGLNQAAPGVPPGLVPAGSIAQL